VVFVFPVSSQITEDAADGKITGSIINGTTGEQIPDLEVILKQYERDQEKDQQKTLSDSQGNFSFPGLDRRKGASYILYTVYQGVEYYSPVLMFNEQTQEIPFEITVYEPTEDIKPGRKEIVFAYKIDYGFSSATLLKEINLITKTLQSKERLKSDD